MIELSPGVWVGEDELRFTYTAGTGPGGQNVNKVATTAQLRFDAAGSACLPDRVRERLPAVAGRRMTAAGEIVITAGRFRTQGQNREDALARLRELVAVAASPPPPKRRKTRPTLASKRRRLAGKAIRAGVKAGRARPDAEA
ncbi:MAG: aminoacyl-tRNA hydrolase [Caulobacteraceae bacterium]|nr:aminoacyl-tRNA hydrolase [Caulobacter sp.]